jgi:hypothetical protein
LIAKAKPETQKNVWMYSVWGWRNQRIMLFVKMKDRDRLSKYFHLKFEALIKD